MESLIKNGTKLAKAGLVSSFFGNMSILKDGKILITKTGMALDELDEESFVEVDLDKECDKDKEASTECNAHRAIYQSTDAKAIIHAHCHYAVVESLLSDAIDPLDSEGGAFLGNVPVIEGEMGSAELAENLSNALKDHKVVIARGHGTFAIGKDITEAFTNTVMAEHSSKVKYHYDLKNENRR